MKTKRLFVLALVLALFATTVGFDGVTVDANAAISLNAVTVSIEVNTGVQSIGVCVGTTYNEDTATVYTTNGTFNALSGITLSWKATAKSGYTMDEASGKFYPAVGLINTISPTATKGSLPSYNLTVNVYTGVKSIVVKYGSSSRTFTASGIISVTSGTSVTWTATAAAGYNLSSSSGSFTMTSAKTIAPTATVKSFTVSVSSYTPSDAYAAFSWTLEWAEGEELTGDPTDYVTMTVASDGMSVTLIFKKAFTDGTMILTCYATNNPSVSATCTVTCG